MIDETTAQIAFVNPGSWAIIGLYWKRSAFTRDCQLPAVSCPVIDTALIDCDEAMRRILNMHISPAGVRDVDVLVARLVGLGATVRYPVAAASVPYIQSSMNFSE